MTFTACGNFVVFIGEFRLYINAGLIAHEKGETWQTLWLWVLSGAMKKGKIVDWLSERADVIARFQGGHNAGHTLVVDGVTYKLHALPSGVVRGGKPSVIGNGVVLDPWHLIKEIDTVRAQALKSVQRH